MHRTIVSVRYGKLRCFCYRNPSFLINLFYNTVEMVGRTACIFFS